jgi:hypothetical protein
MFSIGFFGTALLMLIGVKLFRYMENRVEGGVFTKGREPEPEFSHGQYRIEVEPYDPRIDSSDWLWAKWTVHHNDTYVKSGKTLSNTYESAMSKANQEAAAWVSSDKARRAIEKRTTYL